MNLKSSVRWGVAFILKCPTDFVRTRSVCWISICFEKTEKTVLEQKFVFGDTLPSPEICRGAKLAKMEIRVEQYDLAQHMTDIVSIRSGWVSKFLFRMNLCGKIEPSLDSLCHQSNMFNKSNASVNFRIDMVILSLIMRIFVNWILNSSSSACQL